MSKSKYPPLPIMQCDPNCGECCGVVLCSDAEYAAIENYVSERKLTPQKQGLTCPWYQDGSCKVHTVRPGVCRLFGHVERMNCPKGYNVNIGTRLLREWEDKLLKTPPTRCLHEVFDDWKELLDGGMKSL